MNIKILVKLHQRTPLPVYLTAKVVYVFAASSYEEVYRTIINRRKPQSNVYFYKKF